ncbi:MAG: hypothetical protein FJ276_13985 [Planctomycetes bacterium]|nr:hypothetical protein [Planctomycetota bacterium]
MAAVVLLVPCTARAEMLIRGHTPQRHDRFYVGDDKAFLGQPFDWSGVGRTSDEWVTMVSPSYFLSAAHLAPDTDDSVTFYPGNDKSTPRVYTVAQGGHQVLVNGTPTDLWLGRLTTPLVEGHHINYYPVLSLGSPASYLGKELYNYGLTDRVGRNVLDELVSVTLGGSTGLSMVYDYDNNDVPDVGGDETFLQSGDSGGPSFTVWNGKLALLGIHWFNGKPTGEPWFSGDTFVPHYIDAINGGMGDHRLTLVPEPSGLALWACGGLLVIACVWRGRMRRCRVRSARSG